MDYVFELFAVCVFIAAAAGTVYIVNLFRVLDLLGIGFLEVLFKLG